MIEVDVMINKYSWNYPCLGARRSDRGFIVLFLSEGKGVVLEHQSVVFSTGEYLENFVMSHFKPFDGIITLKNKQED
jgi:hypothetical protein